MLSSLGFKAPGGQGSLQTASRKEPLATSDFLGTIDLLSTKSRLLLWDGSASQLAGMTENSGNDSHPPHYPTL